MQLQELKKTHDACVEALSASKLLLQKRENALATLNHLKETYRSLVTQFHTPQRKEMDLLKEKIIMHQTSLNQLDRELDLLGEELDVQEREIKALLIQKIQEINPTAALEYRAYCTDLSEITTRHTFLQKQIEKFKPFYSLLKEVPQIRKSPFNFLWGRHPKVLLAKIIAEATSKAEGLLITGCHDPFKNYFERFLGEAKKNWNPLFYQEGCLQFSIEFSTLIHNLEKSLSLTEEMVQKKESLLEEWFKKYSAFDYTSIL